MTEIINDEKSSLIHAKNRNSNSLSIENNKIYDNIIYINRYVIFIKIKYRIYEKTIVFISNVFNRDGIRYYNVCF